MQLSLFKKCSRCGETKPRTCFNNDKRYADGLLCWCKDCMREHRKNWGEAHKAERKEYFQQYHVDHIEYEQERNNAWCRARWHNDPEYRKRKNQQKKELFKNKPELSAKATAHKKAKYSNDPEYRKQHSASQRRWNEKLKSTPEGLRRLRDIVNISKHNRRVRIKESGSPVTLNQKQWDELCRRYDYRCLCCGEHKPLEIDHIVPISKGGTNTIDNVQPLCRECNQKKRTQTIDYRVGGAGG